VPEEWVRQCNQMDEVWVPSRFNAETFRSSGVRTPINIVPLGVDPNYFHPGIKAQRFGPRYTFYSVFEWGERKAPELLLRAWAAAFTRRDDVQLVLTVTSTDRLVNVPQEIAALELPTDMAPLAIMYNENIPVWQMGSLYRAADCFVLPTRGEGWGLPILEAMACGLPAIATDWSGQTEFLNTHVAYPLRVRGLVPAMARCRYYPGFEWADPDLEHLVHLLRHVYTHRDEARAVGARAAEYAAAHWTWGHAARKIMERLEEIG
jgi:glycosyltransferase involved in cell wall biosynthesis